MSSGRPRATSRETIAEAACELFLEQGYAVTSVSDIAQRAGVSRSSFFNYFDGKADIFWAEMDARIDAFAQRPATSRTALQESAAGIGEGWHPDALALALSNAPQMGVAEDLAREGARRVERIADTVAAHLREDGADPVSAEVAGWAIGGAVWAAVRAWARAGAGQADLAGILRSALERAAQALP